MIRLFLGVLLFISSLFALDTTLDLTNFEDRQAVIQEVKKIVLKEEQVAKSYEEYILENYNTPSMLNLLDSNYLGTSFLTQIDTNYFNNISISSTSTLSYALKTQFKSDAYIKSLYESNTFRKRTFYSNNKISFILKDDFAKHLVYLILNQTTGFAGIVDCTTIGSKYCKKGEDIYIYDDKDRTNKLMYYYKGNFKTGPIIITSDKTLQTTNEEFDFLPKGAILYDELGLKYVKTSTGIEDIQ